MNHSTNQPTPADPAAAAPAPPATNAGPLLRQRAEEIARTETPPPAKAARPPPPAAPTHRVASPALVKSIVGHTLHELRVHQIELEMQNEELRQVQAELSAAKARYFDLYDLAPAGYLTVSETGLIREANLTAATLLGVVRSELVKQPLTRFILPADQDSYYLFRQQLLGTDTPQACELRMVKEGGPFFWARLSASATQDAGGVATLRIVLNDITERKQAEARLQELLAQTQQDARTKAELLKEVNHRVKNNLLAILGLVLAEQRHATTENKPVAQRITANLRRRLEGLLEVHQMLSASQWAPMPVTLLAERIIRAALAAAPANRSVTVDVSPSPVKVSPRQASNLALVFNELATNTVKYALAHRPAARVTLAATATASLIRLEYRDDGPGYPPAVLRQEQLSVGMTLVRDLTTQTLRGQLTLANDAGAVTVLEIKTEEIDRT